jgi:ABC-2 type transport system ATP-binding protein
MRIALGVLAADSGAVRWDGRAIALDVRRRIGYMPEERGLYPRMRVRDQLVYLGRLSGRGRGEVAGTVDGWLERLGLADRARDRVDALSHGNQQRVQLIAALVGEPDLLVLDEPFAGLDPLAIASMSDLLHELAAAGRTILFSSHQLDLVEDICEDVVIIDAGHVVRSGDLAELRAEVPDRFVDVEYRGEPPDPLLVARAEVLQSDAGHLRLRVGRDVELADLVGSMPTGTEVVSFTYQPPTLSELFREAVLQ